MLALGPSTEIKDVPFVIIDCCCICVPGTCPQRSCGPMLTKNGLCHRTNGVLSVDSSKLDSRKPNNRRLTTLGRSRNSKAKDQSLSNQRRTEHQTNNLELGSTMTRQLRRRLRRRMRHNRQRQHPTKRVNRSGNAGRSRRKKPHQRMFLRHG